MRAAVEGYLCRENCEACGHFGVQCATPSQRNVVRLKDLLDEIKGEKGEAAQRWAASYQKSLGEAEASLKREIEAQDRGEDPPLLF